MKKIGLIMANPITNYGAHLQAYATQRIIDILNIESEIIDFTKIKRSSNYFYDLGFFVNVFYSLKARFGHKAGNNNYDDLFLKNQRDRTKVAKEFRSRRLHNIKSFKTYEELVEGAKTYDAVMIGSDQMWSPGSSFRPFNSLRFAPKGVSRISYATSLGVSSYPRYCWKSARDMWTKMNYISVREEQGANIVREICHNKVDVKVVVDPTYLMTKKQWEEVVPAQKMCDKKYVFCYFLGDDENAKLCAKRYAEQHNLHLVSILSCESFSNIDRTFADEVVGAATPEEFINWIRGAESVFTDSFHGLAFSVINHTQFFVFYRKRRDVKQSRNSRIDNILSMWDCKDRLITDPSVDWSRIEINPINYEYVECLVTEKRNDSLDYLKRALGVDEN